MRRRYSIALLFFSLVLLALPRICLAQYQPQYQYYNEGEIIPEKAYEDGNEYRWGKHIWIWQYDQIGEAVEDGRIIFTFRIISGRADSYSTREGDFRINEKDIQHWAIVNGERVAMPYSMFFDGRRALHGWSWEEPFPSDDERPRVASHGCVSVDKIVQLYNWAPKGTPVHIRSKRIGHS